MIWESWLIFAVGFCGGVSILGLAILAPACRELWRDWLARNELPSYSAKWRNIGLHTYDPDRGNETRPLKDVAK